MLKPEDWRYHYTISAMYQRCQQQQDALHHAIQASVLNDKNADIWFHLGELHAEMNAPLQARSSYQRALFIDENHAPSHTALPHLYRKQVSHWHFPMMNDAYRHQAYEHAIITSVKDKIVLEIGAGSGLLSMLAARAGAAHVYACEMMPMIAEKAYEIIQQNGFSDKITVLPKSSYEMQIHADDMPEKADILITETFDSHLIGEGILAIIADAKQRLLKPDAKIIPAQASIMVMAVESEALYHQMLVDNVSGFNLSAFNEFQVRPSIGVKAQEYNFTPLSAPIAAIAYDFKEGALHTPDVEFTLEITQNGRFHALLSWITLNLGDGAIYENSPLHTKEHTNSHWLHTLHPIRIQPTVHKGESVKCIARYTPKQFVFSLR